MDIKDIINKYDKLIYKIATKFYNQDIDDLYQVGVIGLINACKNYKENNNTKFITYAYEYIFGEMYKYTNENRTIKLNRDILKTYKKIEQTKYLLAQKLNHLPSTSELSLYLEIDEEIINNTIIYASKIINLDNTYNEEIDLYNKISNPKDNINEVNMDIKDSIKTLNKQEQQIINMRYYKDMSQQETAKKLNMTQVMVSRYEKKSLNKMHDYLIA